MKNSNTQYNRPKYMAYSVVFNLSYDKQPVNFTSDEKFYIGKVFSMIENHEQSGFPMEKHYEIKSITKNSLTSRIDLEVVMVTKPIEKPLKFENGTEVYFINNDHYLKGFVHNKFSLSGDDVRISVGETSFYDSVEIKYVFEDLRELLEYAENNNIELFNSPYAKSHYIPHDSGLEEYDKVFFIRNEGVLAYWMFGSIFKIRGNEFTMECEDIERTYTVSDKNVFFTLNDLFSYCYSNGIKLENKPTFDQCPQED